MNRVSQLTLALIFTLLASCGYTSRSTVHSGKEWRSFKNKSSPTLAPVTLKAGERTRAYKNRIGFPPMFGGYTPSLLPEDPTIVKAEVVLIGRGSDIYLTGLRPGTTRIFQTNGLTDPTSQRQNLDPRSFLYSLRVNK